jgi:hypothetical protein
MTAELRWSADFANLADLGGEGLGDSGVAVIS